MPDFVKFYVYMGFMSKKMFKLAQKYSLIIYAKHKIQLKTLINNYLQNLKFLTPKLLYKN